MPMSARCLLNTIAALCILSPQLAWAIAPTADELADARQWMAANCENAKSPATFFSFTYDGKPSAEVLAT
jgi:hypothetical protein